MIKILFLMPNLGHGGAERVLVNLVNNMNKSRFDVTVRTLFDVGVNRKYLNKDVHYVPGFKYYFPGNSHFLKLFSSRSLYRFFTKEKYDIVVSYLEGPTARVVSGCKDKDVKTVAWIHTAFTSKERSCIGFRGAKEAEKGYLSYSKIIAVSQDIKNIMCGMYPGLKDIQVLYNTNETEKIRLLSQECEGVPFEKDVVTVCTSGRLIPVKGFDRLLNVHKRLLDEGIAHKIYILGAGDMQKELKKKISEFGVGDSFILLGFCDNPYKYVSKCDLYVCSSRREGFSTAVTESLIVGTPVVSTDCSGARELLGENNEYGIVTENSEDGIYEGMKKMLSDPELLAHYKKQAAIRGTFFSREKTVKAVEEMFENL